MYINDDFTLRRDDSAEPVICDACDVMNDADISADGHGCGCESAAARWGIKGHPLAMMYAPLQEWRSLYDLDTALSRGTLFSELDLPFLGGKCNIGGGKNG